MCIVGVAMVTGGMETVMFRLGHGSATYMYIRICVVGGYVYVECVSRPVYIFGMYRDKSGCVPGNVC